MTVSIPCECDAEGVAVLQCGSAPLNADMLAALASRVDACIDDDTISGVVLASDDGCFCGELDVDYLRRVSIATPSELEDFVERGMALAMRIESSRKPFAAAIEGAARGVALEVALACHRRVGADSAACAVGFTDLRLGLPPMLGTSARLAARLGTAAARKLLEDSNLLTAAAALKAGLVDELRPAGSVVDEARRWVRATAARRRQRPAEAVVAAQLARGPGVHHAQAVAEYVEVARGAVAQDMLRTFGSSVAAANRLASRPLNVPTRRFSRVGVLGAGLMGSGIALVCARAGMGVTLVDTTLAAAQRGLAALARQEASGIAAGRLDAAESGATLGRITPTERYEDLAGVDIVVEAVFEDRDVKAQATRRAEAAAGPQVLFATNTSTLPITGLAEASVRPAKFIGLHFFSPVPRMPLLEIIRGRATTDETLAHAMDFARAIGKTPIVVHDARGFYTTRVVMAYQAEAFDMLAQGCDPEVVEEGGSAAGMPVPPLALSDAVALDLIHQINVQAARDLGEAYRDTPGYRMVGRLVEQVGRKGKKTGQGFYDYAPDGSKTFWPGLREFAAGSARTPMSVADARDRLLAAQALETVRCLQEGVITDPSQCDVGAVLGWGFAPWTGGPLSWIDRMGVGRCVARCDDLAARYASVRLQPPAALRELARAGSTVYAGSWRRR